MHKLATQWLILPVFILITLLFVGEPINAHHPLFREIWNSGHFFLFVGLVYLLCRLPIAKRQKTILLLIWVMIFSLTFGIVTEFIQLFIGRSFSIDDILKDILGGLVGFCISLVSRANPLKYNMALLLFCALFTFFGLSPLLSALHQEWKIHQSIPILADFETIEEKVRWQFSRADIAIVDSKASRGQGALKATFLPARYPTIKLTDFYRDWRDYQRLEFDIFNPSPASHELVLKIFDASHPKHHYNFFDRFNRKITLEPGWNHLSFSLADIKDSPQKRTMDMKAISSVSFFMVELEEPITLYFDHIRLN